MEALKRALTDDPDIGYAIVFGSAARGTAHAHSDLDVAIGLPEGRRLNALELGDLISRLEKAVGHSVDVVDLEEAPPGLAYRIFRDGQTLVEKDRTRLVARRARAVLEYLDFKPVEEEFARGVLAAASRGR
jgi:predicted nucleotidyltransferase